MEKGPGPCRSTEEEIRSVNKTGGENEMARAQILI